MIQINNAKEWEEFYYYSPDYKPSKYPKEYPCLAKKEKRGGGIVGEYEAHLVAYYPKTKSKNLAFLCGLNYNWEFVC